MERYAQPIQSVRGACLVQPPRITTTKNGEWKTVTVVVWLSAHEYFIRCRCRNENTLSNAIVVSLKDRLCVCDARCAVANCKQHSRISCRSVHRFYVFMITGVKHKHCMRQEAYNSGGWIYHWRVGFIVRPKIEKGTTILSFWAHFTSRGLLAVSHCNFCLQSSVAHTCSSNNSNSNSIKRTCFFHRPRQNIKLKDNSEFEE